MKPVDLNFSISLGWLAQAGFVCFAINKLLYDMAGQYLSASYNLLLFIQKQYWRWGYHKEDYEFGYISSFGVGPLFLISWITYSSTKNKDESEMPSSYYT